MVATLESLNLGQRAAADEAFNFLYSPEKEMGITGPGGTGKTHLVGAIIDHIVPQYFDTCKLMGVEPEFDGVMMTSTTNKAAQVCSLACGRPTSTTASFLNLKVMDDFSTGKSRITKTRSWTIHEKKLIFIDECSMVSGELYQYLQEATHKCKIIYVGDHCQLAPVGEKLSPVYRKGINHVELTEQMRTNIPELQALNLQLRNQVETGEFHPIKIVPGIIDHVSDNELQVLLTQHFSQSGHNDKITAYTNKRVVEFNDHIRSLRHLGDEYQVGEWLVNNSGFQHKRDMIQTEEELEIIHLASDTQMIPMEKNLEGETFLEVREAVLRNRIGMTYERVLLPVDRAHYHALQQYFKKNTNWERYYHLRNNYPDLRMLDASTVHKAQGSSHDTVFIDLGNISTCNIADQVARQLYVATSRARKRVYLYGQLAGKYGGLIT